MQVTHALNRLEDSIREISLPGRVPELSAATSVPPDLTYPELSLSDDIDVRRMNTAVLSIELRRTVMPGQKLQAAHKLQVYLAFLQGILRSAGSFGGHIVSVGGDRVMVVFDEGEDGHAAAIQTAWLLRTVVDEIIAPRFPHRVVRCGIGIDAGRVYGTRVSHHHEDAGACHGGVVWLGKPCLRATRLSDAADRSLHGATRLEQMAGVYARMKEWSWRVGDAYGRVFSQLGGMPGQGSSRQEDRSGTLVRRGGESYRTEPILISGRVMHAFQDANPQDPSVAGMWWRRRHLGLPYLLREVYGSDACYARSAERA